MKEKKFVVARTSSSSTLVDYKVFVSGVARYNGFSAYIEEAVKFEAAQAKAVLKALEAIEQIHSDLLCNGGIKVCYSIEEVQT